MAIGVRGSGSTTADVNAISATITKPAAVAAGDVAVMAVGINALACATPVGWTLVGSVTLSGASTFVYQRVIQSGDTTWTVTPGGGAQQFGAAFQAFTGVDTTTPIDATGATQTSASGTTIVAPLVTVVTDQAWHLIGVGSAQGGGSATSFTALTNGTISNEGAALLYNQTPKGTGSTGTVTVTTVTGAKSVVPFALRPAAAATATDTPAWPIQPANNRVGPVALRALYRPSYPFDSTLAAPTFDYFATRVQLPNNRVGPMALRLAWHSPVPFDVALAAATFDYFGPPARVPNNRVGPMALRSLYRPPVSTFDSSVVAASTANRLRRLICSGA